MRRKILAAAAITAVALATLPAKAQERVEVGTLNCQVAGGTGFVFGSSKALDCELRTVSGLTEQYVGEIKKFGIDIGSTSESVIVWRQRAGRRQQRVDRPSARECLRPVRVEHCRRRLVDRASRGELSRRGPFQSTCC